MDRNKSDTLNDRADFELDRTSKAARTATFLATLQGLHAKQAEGKATKEAEDWRAKNCIDERTGAFTAEFQKELQHITVNQMKELDLASNQKPVPDMFGVLRKNCEACGKQCEGYRSQAVVCPAPKAELDFPTFCTNCGCPACFHQIMRVKGSLSEPLAATFRSYNIR